MNFASIHNYYERLVVDHVMDTVGHLAESNPDYLEDIACVALNQLPARYIRHDVDFVFYMTPGERRDMEKAVENAVAMAVEFVSKHRGKIQQAAAS